MHCRAYTSNESRKYPHVLQTPIPVLSSLPGREPWTLGLSASLWFHTHTQSLFPKVSIQIQVVGHILGSSFRQNRCWELLKSCHLSARLLSCQQKSSEPLCSPSSVSHFKKKGCCRRFSSFSPKGLYFLGKALLFPPHYRFQKEAQPLLRQRKKSEKNDSVIWLSFTYPVQNYLCDFNMAKGRKSNNFSP